MGNAVAPPAKDHNRRNALLRRARSPDLLLGPSLQPLKAFLSVLLSSLSRLLPL
jgi:hypothetical protein